MCCYWYRVSGFAGSYFFHYTTEENQRSGHPGAGASVANIVLLFKEFLVLITAFVIAAPLAWLAAMQINRIFAYRISDIGWGVFYTGHVFSNGDYTGNNQFPIVSGDQAEPDAKSLKSE